MRGRETEKVVMSSVISAPDCIEETKLNCPLKIEPNS
jgi:hypothetical protein